MSSLLPNHLSGPPASKGQPAVDIRRESVPVQQNKTYNHTVLPEYVYEPEYDEFRPYVRAGLRSDPEGNRAERTGPSVKIPMEFDQHGAELGKDARFWRAYVKEADEWDEELVNGWNKSLDVTLVFAALFSAILTAFLIEISSRLRDEPDDEALKTLITISETLMVIANGTRPGQVFSSPSGQPTSFAPSHAAVLVSTIWYLSLSLSVATSFLAMLGKNWCHSFMSGRTGHPCVQARRRQQKWTMIERWKLQEFLTMLPSLIHLALLLFSIGLCIYVWELNHTAALPVMCVTAAAVGFYICSSLAASILDYFPYTTTTSRILRSKPMKEVYLVAFWILQPALVFLAFIPMLFLIIAERLTRCPPVLHRHVDKWLECFVEWPNNSPVMLPRNFPEVKRDENPKQDKVTSNALYWLIRNCEVPSSVDIALQAIAGANRDLPRQPLNTCKAALLISRRLVSGRLYKESAMDRRCIDLYVRALSFLGSSPTSQDTVPRSSINEVEVMIWDLQSGIENKAASLIIDGNFMPDNHNLLALRIGSMAASQGLQRLNGQADDTMVKITHLFEQHLAGVHELHSAALVSLVNAATLLSICTPCGTETVSLASLCMQLFDKNIYWLNIEPKYGITLAMCALLQNKHADRRSSAGQVDTRWVHSAMHILLESQGPRKESPGKLAWFATAEVLSNPQAYGIEFSHVPKLRNLLNSAVKSITSIWMAIPEDHHTSLNETLIEPHLDNLQRIYILSRVGAPVAEVYAFVLESMCRDSSVRTRELCGNLMSRFRFPTLSTEMVECMARRNLIKTLANAIHHKSGIIKLFAVSQMWIFYTLCIDCYTSCETDRDKLLDLLKTYCPREGQEIGQVRACLGQEVELGCRSLESELGSLRVYVYRVLEHVLFVRDCPSYDSEWKKIQATLVDVPYPLRGPRRSSDSPHPACR